MIERLPTETREHGAEIERIKERWFNGEISLAEKRRLIAEANAFYYGDHTAVITKRHLVVVAEERELVPAALTTSPLWTDEEEQEPWYKRM